MTLVLFDIDGTLLYSRGCGAAATRLAMQEVFGTVGSLEQFRFGGKTDWQMLLETLDGHFAPEHIAAQLPLYDEVLGRHLAAIIREFDVQPCPGAVELVQHCVADQGITVGLLTANMPTSAWIKLTAAGYSPHWFEFGVFGSEAPHRSALTPIALERARQLKQRTYHAGDVVVIGDTPEDIACAHAIQARVIAVATGRYHPDELAACQPDMVLANLADDAQVLTLIQRG